MVWGSFGSLGPGRLAVIVETINSALTANHKEEHPDTSSSLDP